MNRVLHWLRHGARLIDGSCQRCDRSEPPSDEAILALARKWAPRVRGAHMVNMRVRKNGEWKEYEADDVASLLRRSYMPEGAAIGRKDGTYYG